MFFNYLKIALRNLRKHGGFTFINVFGLAVGIASCLLIALYVVDELSYDRFHEKADRIYRINSDIKFGGNAMQLAVTSDPMGPTLHRDYPQVENFVRFHQRGAFLVGRPGQPNQFRETEVLFADSTLFDVFTLPLVAGDARKALTEPNTVVISETMARKYFRDQNPLGQPIVFDRRNTARVTGVFRDLPDNSHVKAGFFLSMKTDDYQQGNFLSHNHHTYLLLKPGTDPKAFEKNFETVIQKYVGPQAFQLIGATMDQFRKAGNRISYSLMPLTDIHLHSRQNIELRPAGDMQYVYIFSAVAIFILLIACINFMNLSTARSSNRAKEVGVRKVLGSERAQLMRQFIIESILLASLALGLALAVVRLTLPFFNELASKSLTIGYLFGPTVLPWLLALPLVVGLLAGSYPAFFLSSFRPLAVLKGGAFGRMKVGVQTAGLRSGLVVFQFMMSVVLIIGTIVVYRQINYIQTTKLGFNRERVVIINETHGLGKQVQAFKEEVLRVPGVVTGTLSGYLPVPSSRSDNPLFPEGEIDQNKAVSAQTWAVDHDYIRTLGMDLVAGRDFSRQFGADSSGIILNEAAVKLFGFTDPIGKRIMQVVDVQTKAVKTYTVIGVVKNFHYESLRQNIGAVALKLEDGPWSAAFRLDTKDLQGVLGQIEAKWKQFAPGQPFSYSFMEDDFDAMYRTEQRVGTLALAFAVLAVLVACLGLFGLAAFTAEQRTKEIGIRKVLGASVPSIVGLLSRDFLKLVLIAILIATPLAWWAMDRWLQDFAYKSDQPWWVFGLAGVLAVGIAFLTVSYQSIRAALMNPVKSLKSD